MPSTINPRSLVGKDLRALEGGADAVSVDSMYVPDFWAEHAMREVYNTYGDVVEVKPKSLNKFGENPLVGTDEAHLMQLPVGVLSETFAATNAIAYVSSSSAADTMVMRVEGHTVDGNGDFTFATQTVTLAGQTKTAIGTPLARITRMENQGSTNAAGVIYAYEDDTVTAGVPDTGSKVHIILNDGENQSLKAGTTISAADYYFVTDIFAAVNKKTAAGAVIRLRVRTKGGVFKTKYKLGINSQGGSLSQDIRPYLIIPQNADVILTAEADGASTPIAGGFNGILATVVEDN